METILIGIDPGSMDRTGVAVWSCSEKQFLLLKTCNIINAFDIVLSYQNDKKYDLLEVVIEDARKIKYIPKHWGRERLQGAGSVKRDCKMWEQFLIKNKIQHSFLAPQKAKTKYTADYFNKLTGWVGSSSYHSRDAGMLVFGRRQSATICSQVSENIAQLKAIKTKPVFTEPPRKVKKNYSNMLQAYTDTAGRVHNKIELF